MDFRGESFLSAKWLGRARIDTDIRPPKSRQNTTRIGCRVWQVSIPMAGADAEEVRGGMVCGSQNGKDILFAAIRIHLVWISDNEEIDSSYIMSFEMAEINCVLYCPQLWRGSPVSTSSHN